MNLVSDKIKRKTGRNHGVVFTSSNVVSFILDEVNYRQDLNLNNIRILEPAAGNGSFALEIIKRLYNSSITYQFDFITALKNNVRFIELDTQSYYHLIYRINQFFSRNTIDYQIQEGNEIINTDFLTHYFYEYFDCIVGNPPYIRHELIPEKYKKEYRKRFKTFKYRADIYILFYEKSLQLLNKNGLLSFICSNRWLYNQYGQLLRDEISKNYNLKKILNIENSSPFDENVIAYPCVTTIENSPRKKETIYFESSSEVINFNSLEFQKIKNPTDSSWENIFLKYNINHSALNGIIEQDFEIGIGVATGADKVFIIHEAQKNEIESSRYLPLVTTKDLLSDRINWKKQFVVNPYENGHLCNLEKYPKLKHYLEQHKEKLKQRHTAKTNPEKWYKTIDKIKPELVTKPKLLLPDIAGIKKLLIDNGEFYPHHNLYYITGQPVDKLKILASILMSDFTREQLSQIGIRMNGGFPRFQAQILKKLRIPNIDYLTSGEKDMLIESYDNLDLSLINRIIKKYCTQHFV
ncbi:MAG: Eco57I restriction-modification methylase domain-containing protein [Bacteroidales bacterium]|nr:Eco57I restriction-modification methylase domain-containing protein [Bacteroidales bacterium]